MALVLGIDLGTTNSCGAIFRNGVVEIIKTSDGDSITPSFVYYGTGETLVGKEAKKQSIKNERNGIYDSKRLIGRSFKDIMAQRKNTAKYPFKIIKEHNDEPIIELDLKNDKKKLVRPEEVSAEILMKIMENTMKFLGERIKNVVITVPAYFSNPQRQATKDAAKIAGLNVLKLLNEPTAAALAYFEQEQPTDEKTVLVYDLGGGTFDVSVIKYKDGESEVLGVDGDPFLGGRNFDDRLMYYCVEEIKRIYEVSIVAKLSGDDNNSRRILRRLREASEEAKKHLTRDTSTTIDLPRLLDEIDVELEITRQRFEEINIVLFAKTIYIVQKLLDSLELKKESIDEVILVGGSTRIPKIEQFVSDFFELKSLNKSLNREEAVAIGAALQAALLSNHMGQRRNRFLSNLTDVTAYSLGIEVHSTTKKNTNVLIKRNSKIPTSAIKNFKTASDNQTEIVLNIFEGENKNIIDNYHLGALKIEGITPKKAGKVEVQVKFEVDINGILTVSAIENSNNISKQVRINLANGRLTDKQIEDMQKDLYESHEYDYICIDKEEVKHTDMLNSQKMFAEKIAKEARILKEAKKIDNYPKSMGDKIEIDAGPSHASSEAEGPTIEENVEDARKMLAAMLAKQCQDKKRNQFEN